MEQGRFGFSLQQQMIFNDELTDEELEAFGESGEEIHSTESLFSTSLGGAFGLTENLTVGFSLPYVSRQDIREAHHDEDEHEDGHEEPGEEHHEEAQRQILRAVA